MLTSFFSELDLLHDHCFQSFAASRKARRGAVIDLTNLGRARQLQSFDPDDFIGVGDAIAL